MAERRELAPLAKALHAAVRLLLTAGQRGVVIGGVAVALLGQPRLTQDVDLLVLDEGLDLPTFLGQAAALGLVPRRPDALDFARAHRVLLLRHEATQRDVDISLGMLPFEREVVENARKVVVFGVAIPLASPENLIIMKAIAHRGRDSKDIEALLELNPGLDLTRIRKWVAEFAAVLEMPELVDDLEFLLRGKRSRSYL